MCQVSPYLHISTNKGHPLHEELRKAKGTRVNRETWLGQVEDVVQCLCDLKDIMPGEEWTIVPINFRISFRIITLDRVCVQENLMALISEIKTLMSENSTEADIIIVTNGLVVRSLRSVEGKWSRRCGAYAVTTSSMTTWDHGSDKDYVIAGVWVHTCLLSQWFNEYT